MSKKFTNEKWIEKANYIHENFYDYSKTIYKGATQKVNIICPIHGEFSVKASSHLEGSKCMSCFRESKRFNKEDFINKANKIHKFKYDYSKVIYTDSYSKVTITCPTHGDFEQEANSHLQGKGCIKCKYENQGNLTKYTLGEFIDIANSVHKNVYDYSLVDYINVKTKVKIICSKHGIFEQDPDHHIYRKQGCPICSLSKGELLIYNWLKENNIKFKREFELITPEIARNSNLMLVDFFVVHNEKQYFIEYDGIQHFEYNSHFHKEDDDFFKQQRRDRVLNDFCELHKDKVTLIRFKYDQLDEEILNILENILKINKI